MSDNGDWCMSADRGGPPLHEVVGAIHIHSDYSDGTRSIPEIARIARSVGLDYLLFADHRTLKSLQDGLEGWYGNTLALIGYEINDRNNINHYLAFGLKKVLDPDLEAPEYVRGVKQAGGIGFIAHPDEMRDAFPEHPPYPWTHWEVEEYDGIEIWNHSSEWLERLTPYNKYISIIRPRSALNGPPEATLKRWDRLNQKRCVPGIGGIDAHSYPYKWGPFTFKIFPYKILCQAIRTHFLLSRELPRDVEQAKSLIFDALTRARGFISNYRWGDARGFRFFARHGEDTYYMGDSISDSDIVEFVVLSPLRGTIILKRNGEPIGSIKGRNFLFRSDKKGAYRVEVTRRGKVWVFSNHIRVL